MNNKQLLLPHHFKYVGAITCIAIPVLAFLLMNNILEGIDKSIIGYIAFTGITLGFSFIAFAKEKVEDEMMDSIRLRAIMITFLFTILYFSFITPIGDWIMTSSIEEISSYRIMPTMLLVYILIFHLLKWRLK